ncbi:hypothetical protein DEA98_21370 [Brucella pseudogrignonensis]|nr:hypothetical protein [Brucella pseudogrignonensis]
MDERLARTIDAIKASGADWGIFTSPDGIAYASGHIVSIEAGPSPLRVDLPSHWLAKTANADLL